MRAFKHPPVSQLTLERMLHALSDPTRLEIVRHLDRVEAANCGELDAGRPKSSMSHHFRILRDAGLVHTRAEGTVHQNSLRRADLEARFPGLLQAVLAQTTKPEVIDASE
jgi:DNA-binding transcriptional ArsR family regulator